MRLKSMFPLLPDTPAIYQAWENLVIRYQVSGKPAHDARLVAAMQVHGLNTILTFDKTGFSGYASIEVMHPADAATGPFDKTFTQPRVLADSRRANHASPLPPLSA